MFETVADHAASYRRRIAEILGRILGRAAPAEVGCAEKRDRTMAMALRLAILLLVAGALAYGIWRGSARPPPPAPRLPAAMSGELVALLQNYEQNENHFIRGYYFWHLASGLDASVREGKLELSPVEVADLLGPPDHVGSGLPLTWEYRCWFGENNYGKARAIFHGDQLARVEFETWAEPREADRQPSPAAEEIKGPFLADFTLSACLRDYLMREGHAHRGPYFLTLAQVLDEAARGNTLALTTVQAEDMLGKPDRVEEGSPRQWVYYYADRAGKPEWMATLVIAEDKVKAFRFEKRPKAGDTISPP